ncbi:UNVERIFIED_CONTAM: hypothetical protein NCL1_53082 [Trichonephila clavipes]
MNFIVVHGIYRRSFTLHGNNSQQYFQYTLCIETKEAASSCAIWKDNLPISSILHVHVQKNSGSNTSGIYLDLHPTLAECNSRSKLKLHHTCNICINQ